MSVNVAGWHTQHHADVAFSDEEVWALSRIDADDPSMLMGSVSIAEKEMLCQRDMRVRGRRLWNYHERVGDLLDYITPNAALVRGGQIIGHVHVNWGGLA